MAGSIIGILALLGFIVYFVWRQANKKKVHAGVAQTVQSSVALSTPCRVQIFRDGSDQTDQIRKWPYAFALNNGEKQPVNDGTTIEFTTIIKNNALVGYGRGDYGGLSRHPSLDSPFTFEAQDGGVIQLVAKPEFDYTGGNGKWKSNLGYFQQ